MTANPPALVQLRVRDPLVKQGNVAFGGVFSMDQPSPGPSSSDPSPPWADGPIATSSYFYRTAPDLASGSNDCYFDAPFTPNGDEGTYGISTGGAVVVVGTATGGIYGVAIPTPLECGWDPGLLTGVPSGFQTGWTAGVPVFFSFQ